MGCCGKNSDDERTDNVEMKGGAKGGKAGWLAGWVAGMMKLIVFICIIWIVNVVHQFQEGCFNLLKPPI
jgi:hypothetical protein